MSNPPTLKSIAQRVGMTANTVSLALRDSPLVAENTKARIQKAAEEMGYVQNAIAGSLRSGRTNTVAVVMGDIANPLFAAKIKALFFGEYRNFSNPIQTLTKAAKQISSYKILPGAIGSMASSSKFFLNRH